MKRRVADHHDKEEYDNKEEGLIPIVAERGSDNDNNRNCKVYVETIKTPERRGVKGHHRRRQWSEGEG